MKAISMILAGLALASLSADAGSFFKELSSDIPGIYHLNRLDMSANPSFSYHRSATNAELVLFPSGRLYFEFDFHESRSGQYGWAGTSQAVTAVVSPKSASGRCHVEGRWKLTELSDSIQLTLEGEMVRYTMKESENEAKDYKPIYTNYHLFLLYPEAGRRKIVTLAAVTHALEEAAGKDVHWKDFRQEEFVRMEPQDALKQHDDSNKLLKSAIKAYIDMTESASQMPSNSTLSALDRGEAGYMKTRDGRAAIWNNNYRSDDVATWSGETDGQGYATGSGTLTWHKDGSPRWAYTGTMMKGKLSGLVKNRDHDGNRSTGHYRSGKKAGVWNFTSSSGRTWTKDYSNL